MDTFFNSICNACIELLVWWSKNSSFTYSEINVWLFIILQPLLIILFAAATVFNCYSANNRFKTIIAKSSIATIILLVILTIILIVIPISNGALSNNT